MKRSKKLLSLLLTLALGLTLLPAVTLPASAAAGDYNAGDIAVINNMIKNNWPSWSKPTIANPADGSYVPADWTFVTWSGGATNKRITELDIHAQFLTDELDLRGLTELIRARCEMNQFLSLNVSGLSKLKYLDCSSGFLEQLDATSLSSLEELYCIANRLGNLKVSGLSSLKIINCERNDLSSLDTSGLTSLTKLYCSENKITALDLQTNSSLIVLDCTNNLLRMLDLTEINRFAKVECQKNNMSTAADVINPKSVSVSFLPQNPASIVVGEQTGSVISGTPGTVTYNLETNGIPNGTYTAFLSLGAKSVLPRTVAITDGAGILTLDTTQFATAGVRTAFIIVNNVTSNSFKLKIERGITVIYNPGDIAVINAMIDNNELPLSKAYVTDGSSIPDDWQPAVSWTNDAVDKRINQLYFEGFRLTGALDVSGLSELQSLVCANSELTGLNLSGLYKLSYLNCSSNILTALDVSDATSLRQLFCNNNFLTGLDVTGLSSLYTLHCQDNLMASEDDLVGDSSPPTMVQVFYQQKTAYIKVGAQTGSVKHGVGGSVTYSLTTLGLTDGTYPVSYPSLVFETPVGVTTADVTISGNTGTLTLTVPPSILPGTYRLIISLNHVHSHIFSFTVDYGDLTLYNADDVAAINAMIDNNGLTATKAIPADGASVPINWDGIVYWSDDPINKRVRSLSLSSKSLTGALDVSTLTALEALSCEDNQLTALYLGELPALTYLDCGANELAELDVSGLTALEDLGCRENEIAELDVGNLTKLTSLECHQNILIELDVRNLTELTWLDCSSNGLTGLDVSNLTKLNTLYCTYNNMESTADIIGLRQGATLHFDDQNTTIVSVGEQNEFLTPGVAGDATFPISTKLIVDGTYTPVFTGLPAGVTAQNVTVVEDENINWSGTLTLSVPNTVPRGVYPLSVSVDNTRSNRFYLVVGVIDVNVTFTAEQTGGESGVANSTAIVLTFSEPVSGLTSGNITLTDGLGAALKGAVLTPSDNGAKWTLALASVTTEGSIGVKVNDFGAFVVKNSHQPATVYKDTAPPTLYTAENRRLSATDATVKLLVTEAGTGFYQLDGAPPASAAVLIASPQQTVSVPVGEETLDFTTLSDGAHTLYYAARDAAGNVSALLTVAIPNFDSAATYTIDATVLTAFDTREVSYSPPEDQAVVITNTGTGPVTLTQPTSAKYAIGTLIRPNLDANGATTIITISPKAGLPVGVHDEVITINGTSGATATVNASFEVVAAGTPAVSGVIVSPLTASVNKGATQTFTATVNGLNSPSQQVTWTVEGGVPGTAITSAGVLTIDANETAPTLTVRATSMENATKSGTAAVTVTVPSLPPAGSGGGGVTTYTVKFDSQGGSTVADKSATANGTLSKPADPTREGYTFTGWYTDKECTVKYDFSAKVTNGFTLYAGWGKKANTGWQNPFTDVKIADWFYENVRYVHDNGLMTGTSDTTFASNLNLSRAMLVTILHRAAGSPEVEDMYAAHMMDVVDGSWYSDAMGWAVKEGIISGYGGGLYGSNDPITREQLVTLLYRYAGEPELTAGQLEFADVTDVSDWAFDAFVWATSEGIVSGKPGNLLDPQGTATRAETAAVLQRFLEK